MRLLQQFEPEPKGQAQIQGNPFPCQAEQQGRDTFEFGHKY